MGGVDENISAGVGFGGGGVGVRAAHGARLATASDGFSIAFLLTMGAGAARPYLPWPAAWQVKTLARPLVSLPTAHVQSSMDLVNVSDTGQQPRQLMLDII